MSEIEYTVGFIKEYTVRHHQLLQQLPDGHYALLGHKYKYLVAFKKTEADGNYKILAVPFSEAGCGRIADLRGQWTQRVYKNLTEFLNSISKEYGVELKTPLTKAIYANPKMLENVVIYENGELKTQWAWDGDITPISNENVSRKIPMGFYSRDSQRHKEDVDVSSSQHFQP